ncbi:MAG: aminoglycoside phosphotransferase family protein [Planctomycetota bacterium]
MEAENRLSEVVRMAAEFAVPGRLVAHAPFAGGHINDSYVLSYAPESHGPPSTDSTSDRRRYLLQRINARVFPRPILLMENMARVTAHVAERLRARGVADALRRVLTLVPTHAGAPYAISTAGECWRMLVFIEDARSCLEVGDPVQAEAAARAFGEFQCLLADLPGPRLHETILGFHDTPARLAALERAVATDACGRVAAAAQEIDACLSRRALAGVLVDLHRRGVIPERIVHNDAKIANVLFDVATGAALCVIDLDTVGPGLSLYDFGDMVRSMSCTAAEDEPDCAKMAVAPELFAALARGYRDGAGDLLGPAELDHFVTAGQLITYEQALRFLTDYLCGDTYYRTARAGHNLERCRTQLALLESLERHQAELEDAACAR